MCSQTKLCTMLTTLQRILFFVSAVLLISESTGMVTTHDVFTRRGDIIRLNCSGVHQNRLWRGPGLTNKAKNTLYFDGLQKSPKLTLNNVKLDEDQATKKYNLVISNLTTQNVGVYSCKIPTSQGFTEHVFRVSFESVAGDASLSTQNTPTDADTHSESQTYQQLFPPIFGGLSGGIFLLLVSLSLCCYYRKRRVVQDFQPSTGEPEYDEIGTINYNSTELRINPNNNDFRQTEHNTSNSIPLSEENTEQGERLENVMDDEENSNGSSNTEAVSIETSGYENPYQSLLHDNNSEDHPYSGCTINQKINDNGLNYSEILHEPVPSGGIGVIHGTDDRVAYVEIDHATIISKTDKIRDENIYENDSTDFKK